MSRFLAPLAAATLLAASGVAQCADVSAPGTLLGLGDDTLFAHTPLGFTFTMNGQYGPLAPYTHFRACTNGWVALTNGVVGSGLPTTAVYGTASDMVSIAGGAPRLMPYFGDNDLDAPAGVYFKTVPGVSCTITWKDLEDYSAAGTFPNKSMTCTLFATGVVKFAYSSGFNMDSVTDVSPVKYVAVSPGNGIAVPAASNLAVNGASGSNCVFETFDTVGEFDLGGREITFTPVGGGGWTWATTCQGAHNQSYGDGCYNERQTAYQMFSDALAASLALPGNVLRLTNTGTGYLATWLPGSAGALYVPPTGAATALTASDDGNDTIAPSVALTVPGGSEPSLTISHNGIITCGGVSNHGAGYTPTGPEVAAALSRAFYSWHDYADQDGGAIKYEEATVGPNQILYVTWDGVDMWPLGVPNPNTLQFQLNLTTGDVTILWTVIDPDTSSIYWSAHLAGYTGPGGLSDPGSQVLSATLPQILNDNELLPLTLTASPPPTFPVGGSSVPITYQVNNLRDLSPPLPGFFLATLVFSFNPPIIPGGIDLTLVGVNAPGCNLLVGTLDVLYNISPTSSSHGEVIVVPQPLAPGTTFYVQAANFLIPNSLPNGQNGFGLIVSNGVQSRFDLF